MVGLRVRLPGRRPVVMGLAQERFLIAAGASWRHQLGGRATPISFHGTGLDDRDLFLKWFWAANRRRGSWMEISVVTEGDPDPPRRQPLRSAGWYRRMFAKMRDRDRVRATKLSRRIEELRSAPSLHAAPTAPPLPARTPVVGFRVSLNGQMLETAGVAPPGTLDVTVYVVRRDGRDRICLHLDGGEQIAPRIWRWRTWPWGNRRLKEGDRIRIQVVAPSRVDLGHIQEVVNHEPTIDELRKDLRQLRNRLRTRWYTKEAIKTAAFELERRAPRRYPRARSVLR